METLESSRLFTVVASALITFGLYHQMLKIWKTKSAKDIALSIVLALLCNEIAWLNYGIHLREWPIIGVSCANIPAVILLTMGYLRYRRK